MHECTKNNLKSCDVWMRAFYMLLLAVCYGITKILIFAIALFQFLMFLFTRNINQPLQSFSQGISTYVYQIIRFLTFNTDKKPFPFSDWPTGAPEGDDLVNNFTFNTSYNHQASTHTDNHQEKTDVSSSATAPSEEKSDAIQATPPPVEDASDASSGKTSKENKESNPS